MLIILMCGECATLLLHKILFMVCYSIYCPSIIRWVVFPVALPKERNALFYGTANVVVQDLPKAGVRGIYGDRMQGLRGLLLDPCLQSLL